MPDTNDKIRSALVAGLINPWVGLAFCIGFGCGYLAKALIG